ncbi:uncharacterized protein N0V89_000533 [Didymosphaeria variabile]|uniref:RING-type domain-containing protein n=1 Tax=Didymosphaeria variabile TaxID=1932322 RepID=A0A9W9CFS9_9PLEO|nr:uncharacterized protein N0V89_000533 [Didymosphaeria variabile]KAJ4359974.1 hypothetical protein N0V89_000533 [Didymosphaeria variabile]
MADTLVPNPALSSLLAHVIDNTDLRNITALIQQDIAQASLIGGTEPTVHTSPFVDLVDTRVSKHGMAFPGRTRILYRTFRVSILEAVCELDIEDFQQLINEARKGWESAAMIERWFLECAIAASELKPVLTARLTQYLQQPRYEAHDRASESTPADLNQSLQSPHLEMTLLFRKLAGGALGRRPTEDEIVCILQQLVLIGTDTCSAIEKVLGDFFRLRSAMNRTHAENHSRFLIDRICYASIKPFDAMLSDPQSAISLPVRGLLQTMRPEHFVRQVLRATFPYPPGVQRPGVFSHAEYVRHMPETSLCVYRSIMHAAVSPSVDIDGSIRQVVEARFDDNWKANSRVASPAPFFPPGWRLPNAVWRTHVRNDFQHALDEALASNDHFEQEFDITEDVPLVAIGDKLVPSDYSSSTHAYAADDLCTVCMEKFAETLDIRCMKLRFCGHLFHEACLDDLINVATQNDYIQCPYCRCNICEPRPVRGVPDEAATDNEAEDS